VFLKNEFSISNSGAPGILGSAFGAGRMFGGISEGGSTGAVAEGDGAAREAAICASAAWAEVLSGEGED
jgi:hypothetical protein